MNDVGGTLAFHDVALSGALPTGLPRLIPQVDGSNIADLDHHLAWPAYGIGLRRVFSPTTKDIYPRYAGHTAHDVLGLHPGQLAVLVGYGEDPLVEAFWTRRHSHRLIDQIARQGWDLVLAPNYSIYGNWPRTEHLLNMRRSLLLAKELHAAGAVAVPNVYWYRLEDLQRWAAWTVDTNPPAIAVNLQTVRHNTDWDTWALPGLYWLAENLPSHLTVVLTGLSRADRIGLMAELFGTRLVVVSQNPYQYAMHGAVMTPKGRINAHARTPDAFATTVRYMADLLVNPAELNPAGNIDERSEP